LMHYSSSYGDADRYFLLPCLKLYPSLLKCRRSSNSMLQPRILSIERRKNRKRIRKHHYSMFTHYSSFIPLVLVLFVCGTFTVTNISLCDHEVLRITMSYE
jgi:uncharacterized MAPEG superfamily protein